jgi:hypothetical protein
VLIDEQKQCEGMFGFIIRTVSHAEPLAEEFYNEEVRRAVVTDYLACAEIYGWTWHKTIAGDPRVGLALSLGVPAFLMFKKRRELNHAAAAAAAAERKAQEGEAPQLQPQHMGAMAAAQLGAIDGAGGLPG